MIQKGSSFGIKTNGGGHNAEGGRFHTKMKLRILIFWKVLFILFLKLIYLFSLKEQIGSIQHNIYKNRKKSKH